MTPIEQRNKDAARLLALPKKDRAAAIAWALWRAEADGMRSAVEWHRKQANGMQNIIDDGETGRVGPDAVERARTWQKHHNYCASFLGHSL